MTRSQVASLVAIILVVAAGAGGGFWRFRSTHKMPTPAAPEAPATPSPGSTPGQPQANAPPGATGSREAAPPPSSAPGPSSPEAQAKDQPSFDIVRVEPKGDTVVAGKGAPNAKVALMAGGRKVGEAVSDASGQFVILPPPLPPGNYDLTLRQEADGKPIESKQSVAVSVPQPGKGSVVVALAEPGKATKLLSAPPATAGAAAPLPPDKVAITSAELENGTGFYVTGKAPSGAQVHVYLNDAHIADVVAGADNGWSVRVKKGLTGGRYVVRADVGGNGTGGADGHAVASRAEVPFDVPMAMAAAAEPPAATVASDAPPPSVSTAPSISGAATSSGAEAVVESIATARVTIGDSLWNISRFRLGDGKRYTQIYAANAGQIRNPDLIYPGQVFVVPNR